MDRPDQDKPESREAELDDERPGFTPSGRRSEEAENAALTSETDQSSALGGKVATRSKVKQTD